MDSIEALLGIAQLSLGLVGFAGLASIFVRPRDGQLPPAVSLRIRILIEQGFFTMFAALAPLPLLFANVPAAWRLAAGLLAVSILLFSWFQFRRSARFDLKGDAIDSSTVAWGIRGLTWISALALGGAAAGFMPGVEAAVYIGSGFIGLFLPCLNFLKIVVYEGGAP